MRDWFSDQELEDCPRCGEHTAIPTPTGFVVCTECGIVGGRAEDATASEALTPPPAQAR